MAAAIPLSVKPPGLLVAALAAVASTVLMTWPLARHAGDHILEVPFYWDAYTNAMIMGGHVDAALGRGPLSLYDNYFFAPLPHSLVFNENLFGLSLLFAPFYLVSGNPLWAYNLTLLTSLALSVFFTYLLVQRLTGSGAAGILAGVAFAFSPYIMFEMGRIQLLATQWIPVCFLMLHRSIETKRPRDVAGLWLCFLLQIGTCLYYAMFLIPLLSLVAAVLLIKNKPPPALYVQLAAGGACAGLVALAMVYPYFTAREAFSLERSLAFASSYDGKLSFFSNVNVGNLTLTGLHHFDEKSRAHEEIAFPGFTVLAFLLLTLALRVRAALLQLGLHAVREIALSWLVIGGFAFAATVLTHSMLVGAGVLGLGAWHQLRHSHPLPFSGRSGLYVAALLLAILLFLGLEPLRWRGAPVHGLYYYFHTYFPGFNGIRKVSRQAVMTTFLGVVVASFGSAWLFSKLARPWTRNLALGVLLATTCFELRCFPHPLKDVWAGAAVPQAYRFMTTLPPEDLVAVTPQNTGIQHFRGDAGLAFHNYLMLYHKHRSLNGQSSWMPPVTDLVRRALQYLPDEGARRILQIVGAGHVLIHAEDLDQAHRNLPELLAAQPEYYHRVFQDGLDTVFAVESSADPTLELAETPVMAIGARLIPPGEVTATAHPKPTYSHKAIDGNPHTYWPGPRPQARGNYFELQLAAPQPIVAFEIENHEHIADVPLSYELSVSLGDEGWHTVAEQPAVRLYRDLVYSPKNFVFRIVLPEPVRADKIRITIGQPVPGHYFTIHEARVYASAP